MAYDNNEELDDMAFNANLVRNMLLTGKVPDEKEVRKQKADVKERKKREVKKTAEESKIRFSMERLLPPTELRFNTSLRMNVKFIAHSIPYKEQQWGVSERHVNYDLVEMKTRKENSNIAIKVGGDKDLAYNGDERYFVLKTYETVAYEATELMYIKVTQDKKVIKFINDDKLKKLNVDIQDFRDRAKTLVKKLLI